MSRLKPSVVLAAYADSLVEGRRAVVFGDSLGGLAEKLLERGARFVQVLDREAARVAEATTKNESRDLSFSPPSAPLRDGGFDLAIVEDLNSTGPAHAVLRRLKRALSPRGIAMVAVPNADVARRLLDAPAPPEGALDYYELYDAVRGEFSSVRMLGQAPFVGYAVVDFATEGEPEPSLDTAFVPGGAEEPEWFIAVGSESRLTLDEYSVVGLPLAAVLERPKARAAAPDLTRQLEERDRWIAQLEERSESADARADEAEAELEALREQLTALKDRPRDDARAEALTEDLETAKRRAADSEQLRSRLSALEEELEAAQRRAADGEQLRGRVSALEEELEAAQRRAADGEQLRSRLSAFEEERAQREASSRDREKRIRELEQELRSVRAEVEAAASSEVDRLEAQLLERSATIRELERQLREGERTGKELLMELESRGFSGNGQAVEAPMTLPSGAPGAADAERLAALCAEREADLQAARWTIQALESRLEGSGPPVAEELARARAELSRQAVLIAQLRSSRGGS